MARIKSKIEFYEFVPISTDFKNTPLFDSKAEQTAWFDQYKRTDLTFEGSYQRVEEQISTKFKHEQLVNVNYVHVINPSYEGAPKDTYEWWGFVMDIHYINDGLVTVDWVVDPMQTFMFKVDYSKAFIERGMLKLVREKDAANYYLDESKASILANSEPIGVDGLAYELGWDNVMEGYGETSEIAYMVLIIADAENVSFVGTPSQTAYYVLPYNKNNGKLVDFTVENVKKNNGSTVTVTTSNNSKKTIVDAIEALAKDVKLTNAGGSILTAYTTIEAGFAFDTEVVNGVTRLTTKLKDAEWGGTGQNMELYNIGSLTNGDSGDTGGGDTGGGDTGGGSSTVPSDKYDFLEINIANDFKVDEAKFLQGAKQSARVQSWLGNDDNNIKRVADIVRANGMSPELFFAYDIQEQGTSWGWLNHTYYTGDPYTDADSVSKWAVSQANTTGHVELAWVDVANPYYETPADKQAEGQAFADALPQGAIGRMYLSGTAAATWAAFDPDALKAEVNGVQDYGDPIQGCMDLLKAWSSSSKKDIEKIETKQAEGWGWPFSDDDGNKPWGSDSQLFGTHPEDADIRPPTGFHDGLDFGSIDHPGTNIRCVHSGEVVYADYAPSGYEALGYVIATHSSDGYYVVYQEFGSSSADIKVSVGQQVTLGETIGTRTTEHLHLGITKKDWLEAQSSAFVDDGTWLDPMEIIKNGTGGSDTGGGDTGGGSTGGSPSGINMLKVNRFKFPLKKKKWVQLFTESESEAKSKYQLIRDGLNEILGSLYPDVMDYINSLQGKRGLEKLCCAPFSTLTLTNGKGVQSNFNIANFKNQGEGITVWLQGFLQKTNRVEFYFDDYLTYYNPNNAGVLPRSEAVIRKDSLFDATLKTFDLYVSAEDSNEYLNQNRIRQSYDNAQFALSQNKISNDNSERNFKLNQDRQNQINQISQSGARSQLDLTQQSQWTNFGFGAAKQGVTAGAGAIGNLMGGNVGGAAAGIASAAFGIGMDAAALNASQGYADQALNLSQATSNQALATNQGADKQIFMNSLNTSNLIASNNYDNAIANINAGLADIKNQPDITAVSGSDYNFELAWNNDDIYSVIYTTHPMALMSIAEFFALFGYSIKRYQNVKDYLRVRKSFNYVKTKGANVKGTLSNKWRNNINNILDNGITFWLDKEKMASGDITGNE